MRLYRIIEIIRIILNIILLGVLIILLITTILFWDESRGMKNLLVLAIAIPFIILWIVLLFYFLKLDESFYRENTLKRIRHEKLAVQERENIYSQREGMPGQIDARLNRVITSNLPLLRMLRSEKVIGLMFFFLTSFVFWFIFDFRFRLSLASGLIAGFLTGGLWHIVIRHQIAIIFEKEFPSNSPEREAAIEHLSANRHAYWFARELLKAVGSNSNQRYYNP